MHASFDAAIVVIAFNEEATITDCLAALSCQRTDLSYEVIVVDDGSTDGTAERVRAECAREPHLRLIEHGANRGRGAARRTGQDAAAAPRIGFVDADVIVPPNWIADCASALISHSAVSGVASPDGDCVVLVRLFSPTVRLRRHTMAISGGNVMFDAGDLRAIGFNADARLGEDFRLAHQMEERGMRLATLPDLVSEHRETKSFGATVRWMWQNGVDAARLPFELHLIRTPDVAWAAWFVALLVVVVLACASVTTWVIAVAVGVVATAAVTVGHALSRFRPWPRPLRWVAATIFDLPLISSYLAGRTVGLPVAIARAAVHST